MMARRRGRLRNTTLAALVLLPPVIALVIYSSFQISNVECTVCMEFGGREVCRSVTAQTESEGLRSATANACALLASGMTDSIRCERAPPERVECARIVSGG